MAGLLNPTQVGGMTSPGTSAATEMPPASNIVEPAKGNPKEEKREAINIMLDYIRGTPGFEHMTEPQRAAFKLLASSNRRSNRYGEPIFYQIFGDNPVVGKKAILRDIVAKHYKGIDWMGSMIRKWAAKGPAIVRFNENTASMLDSEYVIESMIGDA